MKMFEKLETRLNGLTDREEVIDAVLRFTQGSDDNDEELVASALADDVVFDTTDFGRVGIPGGRISGRDNVLGVVKAGAMAIDTMHFLGNIRVQLDGTNARLTGDALAQHFAAGDGTKHATNRQFLMGNRFRMELVKDEEGLWRIKRNQIRVSWCHGDIAVLTGLHFDGTGR